MPTIKFEEQLFPHRNNNWDMEIAPVTLRSHYLAKVKEDSVYDNQHAEAVHFCKQLDRKAICGIKKGREMTLIAGQGLWSTLCGVRSSYGHLETLPMVTFETRGDHYVRFYAKIFQQALIMTLIKALGPYHTSYEGPKHSAGQNSMNWYVLSECHVMKILDDHAYPVFTQTDPTLGWHLSFMSLFFQYARILICSVSDTMFASAYLSSQPCIMRRDWFPAFSLI